MNKPFFQFALIAASLAVPPLSHAAPASHGMLMAIDQLPAALRKDVTTQVAKAHQAAPATFEAVAAATGCTNDGYKLRRNPVPGCSTELRAFGPDYGWALVSALVVAEPKTADGRAPYATAAEKAAYTSAAIESLGYYRAANVAPVVRAILLSAAEPTWKVAAAALGRIGTDADLQVLSDLGKTAGPRQMAALYGLGECKRIEAAKVLAAQLAVTTEPSAVTVVAGALGRVASAWAWQAIARKLPAKEAEATDVRTVAAKALAQALLTTTDGDAVEELTQALQMTEHPAMSAILAEVRGHADAVGAARIDVASARYASYIKRR